ncbi:MULTISPECIES: hypothetical protein [unclassified Microcoleus]|uniref:hypothetical protein n=1 Tax=unclassified Microcoleus TaxID=2642155 RepID=UPI002FD3DE0A
MPVPQRIDFLVERAGEPVHKRLIHNGATSQFKPRWDTTAAENDRTLTPQQFTNC